ncbi:MAG: phosphatase PAP2 family protein [Candidatus Niyogibacteria bacterium]|nr:phosphatase PAP2 family protein [Candidatus Niyogibacteria bacterium]
MNYDLLFFQYFNSFAGRSDIFDALILFAASYLQYAVSLAVLVWLWRRRDAALAIGRDILLTVFISRGLIAEAIRFIYKKPRPFEVLDVHQVVNHSAGGAFPSGHAAFFFALGATIFIYDKKWGTGFLAGAALISIARVIGGVHWPLDIIAGAVVGILSVVLVHYGKRFWWRTDQNTKPTA